MKKTELRRVRMYVDNGHAETKPGDWSRRSWKTKLEASHPCHELSRMGEKRRPVRHSHGGRRPGVDVGMALHS